MANRRHPWRLVGREAELRRLREAVADGGGAVLVGTAGVGKTRLLNEAASLADRPGSVVLSIRASRSASGLPLGAFAAYLDPDGASHSLSEARRAILRSAGSALPVLCIDDAHVLDESSAALVHQLAADGEALVLATARIPEPTPSAIVALWKDELCERIEVEPLTRLDVDRLLQEALGGAVDGTTAHRVWEATAGNVLFVRELVTAAVDDGTLVARDGVWTLAGPLGAPPRVRELLVERIADMAGDERTALEALALGEPLPFDVLCALVGPAVVERLEERALVEVGGDAAALEVRLGHPLFGDVVLDRLGGAKRRRLLRSMVDASGDGAAGADAHLRLTAWRIEAGLLVGVDDLLAAARHCLLVDPELAARFARLALDAGGGLAAADTLADMLVLTGRPGDAEILYRGVAAGSPERAAAVESRLAVVRAFGYGEAAEGAARLDQLASEVDGAVWGEVAGRLAVAWFLAGDLRRALTVAEAVVADERTSQLDRLRAEQLVVPALFSTGRAVTAKARAVDILPRVLAETERLGAYGPEQLASSVALAHLYSGDPATAREVAQAVYDDASRRNARLSRGGAALRLGQVAFWRGEIRRAERLFREAIVALEGDEMGLGSALDYLRVALLWLGERNVPDAVPPGGLYAMEHAWLQAIAAGAAGETSTARSLAAEAVRAALHADMATFALFSAFEAARVGAPDAPALLSSVPPVEGALAPALLAAGRALCGREAEAADDAAAALEELGCLLFAAELANTAAVRHAAAGERGPAAAARSRAERLADRCEGATTERLRKIPDTPTLTPREREIATMAGRGVADAEIADRLVISVRTVQAHLHRAYTKLGVTSRRELHGVLDL